MGWAEKAYWTAFSAFHYSRDSAIPFLPAHRLAAIQGRHIGSIVAHAYDSVPFYRRAMDERGLRPVDFRSAADLERLPQISGRELSARPDDFLSTAGGAHALELTTSGSSGHSKRILWDTAAVFRFRAGGRRFRDVVQGWTGTRIRELRFLRPGGTASRWEEFYGRHNWVPPGGRDELRLVSVAEPFAVSLAAIDEFHPNLLSGFGSYVGALLRWALERGRPVHRPAVVVYGGDTMRAEDRRLIEEVLGAPVLDTYQCCEALSIGFRCERRDGYHLNVDQIALRVADAEGRTLPAGEPGRIVISNLTNRATVLLNYEVGDLGALAPTPCPCGRTLPLLARLDGRADDLVRSADGDLIHESLILSRVYAVPGVSRCQLTQDSSSDFSLLVVASQGIEWLPLRQALTGALIELLGPIQLHVTQVEDIPPEPSGKFKSVRCDEKTAREAPSAGLGEASRNLRF